MLHDDVIKWKHFPRYWPFVRGIHRSPVNSPHKGQGHRALMFSLNCVWMNGWVNNREAGDLRRYRAHYDVIVMKRVRLCITMRRRLQKCAGVKRSLHKPETRDVDCEIIVCQCVFRGISDCANVQMYMLDPLKRMHNSHASLYRFCVDTCQICFVRKFWKKKKRNWCGNTNPKRRQLITDDTFQLDCMFIKSSD